MRIKSAIKIPLKYYSKQGADIALAVLVVIMIYCAAFLISWIVMASVGSFVFFENLFMFWNWQQYSRAAMLLVSFIEGSAYLWYIIFKK